MSDENKIDGDDAVIASAFRGSLIAIAVVAVIAAAAWFWVNRPVPVEKVEEAVLDAPELAAPVTIPPPSVTFTDITTQAGIDFRHVTGAFGERLLPETMGGGVAFFDYDNDGDPDLLFVNSGYWPWHNYADGNVKPVSALSLYRNDGAGSFTDVTGNAGLIVDVYGMGVAIGDYDADGHRDIFLSAVGENRLFKNEGGRFSDVTSSTRVGGDDESWSSSAGFFDYDGDGDLDLYVVNYVKWSREIDLAVDYQIAGIGRAYGPPTNYEGAHSYLFRNDDGVFADVTMDAGIAVTNPATGAPAGKGLALMPGDFDADGDIDIAVANDTVRNFYFVNQGDGTFAETGASAGLAFDPNGSATGAMGIDAAWLNDAGDLAIAIGNFANEMTSFYLAQSGGTLFTDEAIVSGVGPASRKALSFGLFFFDYDLDGQPDLFQANGHVENEINRVQASQQYAQPSQLFWNCGLDCPRQFVNVNADVIPEISKPAVGRAAAFADIDADGDLDFVMTQVGGKPRLFRNDQALGNNWIRLKLEQRDGNRDAIGAVVRLTAGGRVQQRLVMPTRSYLSQVEPTVTFGLGESTAVERVEISWPDGTRTMHDDLAPNQLHVIIR